MSKKEDMEDIHRVDSTKIGETVDIDASAEASQYVTESGLQRLLNNRQIQLIAAGGSIGTALFISIGSSLAKGGPANLFIAYTLYCGILAFMNNSLAEMTTHMPVAGGFVRLAGYWVDDALGFMAGWNFFFYEALAIPFEITALTSVLSYWSEDILETGPIAGVCAGTIVIYGFLNVSAIRVYGESEFWLSSGKLILIFLLFAFTFVTMVGGNPQHDAYGFRYWKNPGSFAEYRTEGDLGRFEGFLACVWSASFTIVGPEFISMVSAEAKRPSIYIKAAFKTVYYRFIIFFIFGALAISIVIPYNNPTLVNMWFGDGGGSGSAAGSPYVIAMGLLKINVLPHIVNALIFTSVFSAGNTYTYCAIRALHGLSIEGRAPRFLSYTNRNGVPVYCFLVVMGFCLLSFLQVSNGSAKVLGWLTSLITGGCQINYMVMSITYIRYYKACQVQKVDRTTRPYYGRFQPYGAYIALCFQVVILFTFGYTSFKPWSTADFFANYTMQLVAPLTFIGWKLFKRTKVTKAEDIDLVWERPRVEDYENSLVTPAVGFWTEMLGMIGLRKIAEE